MATKDNTPVRDNYNAYMREYIRRRYLKLKLDAIDYKGGSCIKCGYNKCPASLIFHHRDPDKKEFEWKYLRKRSWEFIKKELDKCDLLCRNCHGETHYDPKIAKEALEWLSQKKRKFRQYDKKGCCENCGSEFQRKYPEHKFCSCACSAKSQEKTRWPSNEELLVLFEEKGQVQVGKQLGLSPRTVKKRIDRIRASSEVFQ